LNSSTINGVFSTNSLNGRQAALFSLLLKPDLELRDSAIAGMFFFQWEGEAGSFFAFLFFGSSSSSSMMELSGWVKGWSGRSFF